MVLKRILKQAYRGVSALGQLPNAIKQANSMSYFPELERKSYLTRLKDNVFWLLRYGEANKFYSLYGMDTKQCVEIFRYKDYIGFMRERNSINRPNTPESQVSILRDKFMFYKYCKQTGIPTPEVFAVMLHGRLFDTDMNEVDSEQYLANETNYFIKEFAGECASFVKYVKDYSQFILLTLDYEGGYIFQRRINQCDKLSLLNPCAINTLRIVTVNRNGNPYVLSAVLRVGTVQSGNVDNWAVGGLSVGVEDTGRLRKYGFYKRTEWGGKTTTHPDTGVIFSEFDIPEYYKCVEAAKAAHRHFYGVRFVGWDIAMTDDGPLFIEGNDNWEISLMQASNEPLRLAWSEAMK